MIQYGLISKRDWDTLELTMLHVLFYFAEVGTISTCEIGIHAGDTSRAINQFILSKGYKNSHTAIDNNHDFEVVNPFPDCVLIIGNSNEVYNRLENNSQHLLFIDALHTFPATVSDFFCYEQKVKVGGYLCFHDTGIHISDFHDYQRVGSKDDKDMYIRVRSALKRIGLLDDKFDGWKLVFDTADNENLAGGICVFKKLR